MFELGKDESILCNLNSDKRFRFPLLTFTRLVTHISDCYEHHQCVTFMVPDFPNPNSVKLHFEIELLILLLDRRRIIFSHMHNKHTLVRAYMRTSVCEGGWMSVVGE